MFIADNIYCVSVNNIKYISKDGLSLTNEPASTYAVLSSYDREDYLTKFEAEAKIRS